MSKFLMGLLSGVLLSVVILVAVLSLPSRDDVWMPLFFGRYSKEADYLRDRPPYGFLASIRERYNNRRPDDPDISLLVEKSFEALPPLMLTNGSTRLDINRNDVEDLCVSGLYHPFWERTPRIQFNIRLTDQSTKELIDFFDAARRDNRLSDAIYLISEGRILNYGFATHFSIQDLKEITRKEGEPLLEVEYQGGYVREAKDFVFKLTKWSGLKPCNPDYFDHSLLIEVFGG